MSSSHVSAISRIENIGRPRGALVQMNSPLRGSKDWKLAREATVEELLVVVEVEGVEVDAGPALDLLDP
jgi:hypothetical protein